MQQKRCVRNLLQSGTKIIIPIGIRVFRKLFQHSVLMDTLLYNKIYRKIVFLYIQYTGNLIAFRNVLLKVNPSDISITPTLVSGQFEVLELDWLVNNYASSLENESLMIDVGANIGIYSSIFVKLSKNFKVMSFEPDPRSHELLEENLKNNCHNHTQYTIKKVAVSSNIGNINLFQDLDAGKSRLDLNSNGSIQVKATSLDEALHNIDLNRFSSIFLKIDVEGFESQVIDSAKNLLQFSRLNILIEYNPLVSKNTNSYLNIWKRLEEKYTTAFVFSHGKRIRWEPSQLKGLPKGDLANILFDYKER